MPARLLDCSMADYQADRVSDVPSLSCSIAKIMLEQSQLHARLAHPRLNPHYEPEEDSRFDIGTAAHAMLLERTSANIIWCEFDDWRKKDAREMRDRVREQGKLPILARYQQVLSAMVAKAHECIHESELAGILDTGTSEQVIAWQEGETHCRSRLDLLSADLRVVLDYKSTENAHPDAFIRQIGRMNYDLQAEFYTRGVKALVGAEPRLVFLAQEITAPFACSLIALSNAYREVGKAKVTRALRLWAECMSTQKWPGYSAQIHYAEPSDWQVADMITSAP